MAPARRLGQVLGGGGNAGIDWHTGVLCGLAQCSVDLTSADRLIGTSAGATVAVQVGGGCAVDELFNRQVDPTSLATELTPGLSVTELWRLMVPIDTESADEDERRRRLGRLALDAHTVDEALRRQVVAARLEGIDWEGDRVSVVACEATTGQRRVSGGSSTAPPAWILSTPWPPAVPCPACGPR